MSADHRIRTSTPEDTQEVGRIMGQEASPGDVFLLTGGLGAGKTCLTQGIAQGLEIAGYVRSPTFVLMTQHRGGRLPLHHIDLYRVESAPEAWDLGIEEPLSDEGVCVVEWADRAAEVFPEGCLWVDLVYAHEESQRTLTFRECPPRYRAMVERIFRDFPPMDEMDS